MDRPVTNLLHLERALERVYEELRELHAEKSVQKILIQHAIVMLIRWAAEPQKYFNEIRESSRANLSDGLRFEDGDPATNEIVRQFALDKHDQMFEEISRALGFRSAVAIQ